jgi:eukaryotic-like serine/threonine-protein kinase
MLPNNAPDGPGATVFMPRPGRDPRSTVQPTAALAPELLKESARRLRVLALLYAFTFFMAGVLPSLLSAQERAHYLQEPTHWAPAVGSIGLALVVAAVTRSARVPLTTVFTVGLIFQIVSCYGIALAEYIQPGRLNAGGWMGLSWVAAWAPLFTVVIPTRPAKAVLFTLASVSAVPVVIGFMVVTGRTSFRPDAALFFLWIILPYLLVALMAYVGARVVYTLGRAITEARELGSYRLVERLGQGGMGEVWRAKHRLLARPAAIKLIRTTQAVGQAGWADTVSRFEREANVTASLSSPHTVQLFDFGSADDGTFYYVMELLNGLDLETMVRRHGPVPAERAIFFLRQVCHSLAEAESFGLVHRDIKPANLFACRYGGEYDFLKVLDFGIAKIARDVVDVVETVAIGVTRDNLVRGTPEYIAPEQAIGGAVDSRADIYATACVGYFLLTGEPVFGGETPMAVVVHHARTPPAPPSTRSEMPIPPGLDRVIMECLAKDPASRPQSAKELSRRLSEIDGLEPWTEGRARAWWETHQPA